MVKCNPETARSKMMVLLKVTMEHTMTMPPTKKPRTTVLPHFNTTVGQ